LLPEEVVVVEFVVAVESYPPVLLLEHASRKTDAVKMSKAFLIIDESAMQTYYQKRAVIHGIARD
jgi:hypothetical protein